MGKPISECSLRELRDKAKFLKTTSLILMSFLAILAAWVIYQLATGGKVLMGAMLPVMVAILCGAIPSFSGLASIKKEVERRLAERK